jgi:uncharacterized membrane protein YhdT
LNKKYRIIFLVIYCGFIVSLSQLASFLPIGWLIGWVVISHLVAEAAERKSKNYPTYLLLSILVSPLLIGLLVALMSSSERK